MTGDLCLGGLLSVDELGLPQEFLHSDPIHPSKLQLSLYGTTMSRYLMVDVIGKGLVEASQSRGAPVVVGHSELLALATKVKRPFVKLQSTNQRPLGEVGDIRENSDTEFAAQLNDVQNPYIFTIFDRQNFPIAQHLPSFIECAARFDVLEPMVRVKRTLEVIQRGGD